MTSFMDILSNGNLIPAVLTVLATAVFGIALYKITEHRHVNALLLRAAIGGLPAIAVFALTKSAYGAQAFRLALIASAITCVLVAIPAIYCFARAHSADSKLAKAKKHIPVAAEIIKVDVDLDDLHRGSTESKFSAEEKAAIRYLIANYDDIGHIVRSSKKTVLLPLPVGPVRIAPVSISSDDIAISPADLAVYEARLRKRHARWLAL